MNSKQKEDIRWTPILQGRQYCSPACGGRCTHKEYKDAVRKSNKLLKVMGPEWKARVYENLGWHYSLQRGPITLYEREKEYSALIDDRLEDPVGGLALWTNDVSKRYSDPKKAVIAAIKQVEEVVMKHNGIFDSLKTIRESMKGKKANG